MGVGVNGSSDVRAAHRLALSVILATTAAARADGPAATTAPADTVANPQYDQWAKYKPGTAVTLVADTDAGGLGRVHLEVTQTLRSITPEAATLSHANRQMIDGRLQPAGRVTTQTIAARQPASAMRDVGSADVQAMGRAFKCRVCEMSQPGPVGQTHVTAYLSDEVPGGVVKLVVRSGKGTAITFLINAISVAP